MGSHRAERRFNVDSVCIIGAGSSGLATAKYLLAENKFSRITILEQRGTVGGVWNYVPTSSSNTGLAIPQTNPQAGHDKPVWNTKEQDGAADFVTPLYDRLETNIPRWLMGYPDFDWPEDCQLFPQHTRVLEYIDRYAEEVRHLIRFRTQVQDVSLTAEKRWKVKSQNIVPGDAGEVEEVYDAVVVANGHFNVPYIPQVEGIAEWNAEYPGIIAHSKFYRKPESYAGKKVIVVGNHASGVDIAAQLETTCRHPLIMSQRSVSYLDVTESPTRVDKPPIEAFLPEDRSVRFADGTVEFGIDAIVYCTGYFYSFPFIPSMEPSLITTGERVENLYQHIFYQPNPTLTFSVLNQKIIPFPLAEVQGAVIARVFSGRLGLPNEDEMKRWEESVIEKMGSGRNFHVLKFPKDAEYLNMLHDWAVTADGEKNGLGKTPPKWREKEFWVRDRFPQIRTAFTAAGAQKGEKKTLESVGFDFEKWKKEQEADGEGAGGV